MKFNFSFLPNIYDKIRGFTLKNHSFSVWSIFRFFLASVFALSVYFATLFFSTVLTISDEQSLTNRQWVIISIGSFVLLFVSYFRNYFRDRRKNRLLEGEKIIYDLIGGAIQELFELKFKPDFTSINYGVEILNYIEKVTIAIFKADGIEVGTICTNLMTRDGDHLQLIDFATKFQDRDKPKIPFHETDPLPGAPEAWVSREVIYVDDIFSEKYKQFFDPKFKFKSFISIPIIKAGSVIAIINIDSNIKRQFVSKDYISKKIMPKITPLLLLFTFKDELENKQNRRKK